MKDLCERLPYGVICKITFDADNIFTETLEGINVKYYNKITTSGASCNIECVNPYLRPMSSMTEEECDMVEEILGDKCIFDFMGNGDIILKQVQFSQNKLAKLYDYYNSIHVDYRGLIPKGLALEATEWMYNLKK